MTISNQHGIEEVFVIKTEDIDFLGAMIREQGGGSAVKGIVSFLDGTQWYFRSSADNRGCVRKRFVSLCENIATSYRADLIRLTFSRIIESEEFVRLLQEVKWKMAYA